MIKRHYLRTVTVKITEQTLFHLTDMARFSGYGRNIGRVIDKLTREKMLSLHENRKTVSDTCVCCGKYVPEGDMVCPTCKDN